MGEFIFKALAYIFKTLIYHTLEGIARYIGLFLLKIKNWSSKSLKELDKEYAGSEKPQVIGFGLFSILLFYFIVKALI